jgi:hypothetical protein
VTYTEIADHRPASTQGLSSQDTRREFHGFCEVRCEITSFRNCSPQLALCSYAKAVNKNTQQLESLLKVIVTPVVSRPLFSLTSRGRPHLCFRILQKASS